MGETIKNRRNPAHGLNSNFSDIYIGRSLPHRRGSPRLSEALSHRVYYSILLLRLQYNYTMLVLKSILLHYLLSRHPRVTAQPSNDKDPSKVPPEIKR